MVVLNFRHSNNVFYTAYTKDLTGQNKLYAELHLTLHRVILKFVCIIMNLIQGNTYAYIG